ncbi:hypothetical protein TanjilG_00389 [Lupinus angustifolius]|uniref:DUF7870 domain-containing protein n=1 Tax=Lupinus angustifolius TaxID=3871 RepID=A0A1J7ICA0_LUPAN|nr:PREDICTED: uncharacterized protein LOC109349278 [Lupinus angustifolius]OIW10451.1 hypothetical protein TanjilG_00389 [Lupinus angustifolius]
MKLMELGREYNKARKWSKLKHLHDFNSDTILVFQIADAHVFSIVSRFLFLAMVFVTLLFLGSIKGSSSSSNSVFFTGFRDSAFESINAEALNLALNELKEEGLVKKEDKALIMSPPSGFEGVALLNNEVDVVKDSDLEIKSSEPDQLYDFVYMPSFEDAKFADRILKPNGIVAFPLSINPSNADFRRPSDYKVVYIRRHGSIIVALRKLGLTDKLADSSPKRKLLTAGAKTVALKGLEDVLLEPPGKDFAKSKENLKIRYLPDLLGEHSLEGYKRKVFLGIGLPEENKAAIEWFERNYPKKNTKFEIHSLIVASEDPVVPHTDISAWLSKHVKEEEYVVMKAEADVVEDMIRKKTTHLVDELFLECNNEWWQTGEVKKSGRAYWECLALYGKLRDEGVAVHQWWGNEADMALN